ncbi:general secretion pathway protein GspN [Luteimonas deserti]|uniref:General secretion pathway protein GspN n=1 Tax=Luteimonas deserti TaxID=2752306 RepID=A0A7Z0QQA7_9GAMM|nr:general secretion pathway protein GspN [Luteimonas deserti]NYZ62877.1 general secretion pathway protein GspN [Luteimonas deserti]
MGIETTNTRTWLVAAVAGWALAVWGLALAGLGGRIGPADDDGATPPPAAAMPAAEAQPPLAAYPEIAARPLFSADRRPHPFFIDPTDEGEGAATGFDYVLTSVLRTPDFAMAILQPVGGGDSIRLRVGEAPPAATGWTLDSVEARRVVFVGPEGPRTLELRVYDGVGGQPPTAMRPPVVAADAASGTDGSRRRAGAPVPSAAAPPPPATPPTRPGSAAAVTAPSPVPPAPAPAVEPVPAAGADSAGPSEAQVEAIRRRIEERRARLRQQQATGGQAP